MNSDNYDVKSLSTAELEELLDRVEVHMRFGQADNAFKIAEVSSELAERYGGQLHREKLHAELWDKLNLKNRDRKKPVLKKTAVIAAIIVFAIVLSMAALAAVPEWFSYIFGKGQLTAEPSGNMHLEDKNAQYESLEAALNNYGAGHLSPGWIPARFHLEAVEVSDLDSTVNIFAWYSDGNGEGLSILISVLSDEDLDTHTSISEIDNSTDTIKINGITHYLDTNMSTPTIKWEYGSSLCSITGNLSAKELEQIVRSIYK